MFFFTGKRAQNAVDKACQINESFLLGKFHRKIAGLGIVYLVHIKDLVCAHQKNDPDDGLDPAALFHILGKNIR